MLKHVRMDKEILKKWLKADYIDNNAFYQTEEGTPQGGIISPTLANITLDGLEAAIHAVTRRRDKINYVRYADDFVVTANSKVILENNEYFEIRNNKMMRTR